MLKPNYKTVLQRCQTRTCHENVTPEYWIDYFYKLLEYNDEVDVIDTTEMTADETAEYIISNYMNK